jgi:hypothetical protein
MLASRHLSNLLLLLLLLLLLVRRVWLLHLPPALGLWQAIRQHADRGIVAAGLAWVKGPAVAGLICRVEDLGVCYQCQQLHDLLLLVVACVCCLRLPPALRLYTCGSGKATARQTADAAA